MLYNLYGGREGRQHNVATMSDEEYIEEIISANPDVPSVKQILYGYSGHAPTEETMETIILNNTDLRPVDIMQYQGPLGASPRHALSTDLSLVNSNFFNAYTGDYPVNSIPHICMANDNIEDMDSPLDLKEIFDEFPFFHFGGLSFTCTHEYDWNFKHEKSGARDIFETRYGIKIDEVYISLNELSRVADFAGIITSIDDFFVTGNYNDTILTIWDNDFTYSSKDSLEKQECNFRPAFAIDRGIPLKYIKTTNDKEPFSGKRDEKLQQEYNIQRKLHLAKLNNIFRHHDANGKDFLNDYPAEIDFIVKTGLRKFTFLSYDRFLQNGDFFITNVHYNTDGTDPKYVIKKCSFQDLPQQIKMIQCARASHFNKMYSGKIK